MPPTAAALMWRFPVAVLSRPLYRRAALTSSFLAGSAATALALQLNAVPAPIAAADGSSSGGSGPPTDAEAEEARRALELYFDTTEPAVGGRGAVRLKQPLVNGEASVDAYKRSLVDHNASSPSSVAAYFLSFGRFFVTVSPKSGAFWVKLAVKSGHLM